MFEIIRNMSFDWEISLESTFLVIFLVIWLFKYTQSGKKGDKIFLPAFIIFLLGWALYFIGFSTGKNAFVSILLRSALSSMEMFVSHSDLIEVAHANEKLVHGDKFYMALFAITHFMAIIMTMLAVLSLLGGKVKQFLKKLRSAFVLCFKAPKDLYIFFGVNEASIITAKRIYDNKDGKKIVFVEFPESEGKDHIGFASLLGLSSLKPGLLDKIEEIDSDILLFYANKSLTDIESLDIRKQRHNNDKKKGRNYKVFNEIGLDGLYGLVRYIKKSQNVKLFFLSNNQQSNIRCFEALCSDPYILKNIEDKHSGIEGPKFTIYCHARRDNLNTVCENRFMDVEKVEVHIVDTSYLSVYYLKTNLRYNPVSFVDIKNGCVTSDFNSMIIGFGETGQDVFGFLHEFSAFEGPDGRKSTVHCTIIDNNMDQIKYTYLASHPALESHSEEIEMLNMTHTSQEFWDTLRLQIKTLNYIVISLGDDEESLSLAISIYYFALRERQNNMNRFKVFVRVYNFDNEKRMNILSNYYNKNNKFDIRKYYPNFIDENLEDIEGDDGTIVIFGELDEIFKLDYIFNEEEGNRTGYVNIAKEFFKSYEAVTHDNDTWEARRKRLIVNSGSDVHRLLKFQELKRKETQDLSNSLHMDTKLQLLGLIPAMPLDDPANRNLAQELLAKYEENMKCIRSYEIGGVMPDDSLLLRKLLNVSKTEHRRWVAKQELMGYSIRTDGLPDCDESTKQHGCMCQWDELDKFKTSGKPYKYYDIATVMTTLELKMEKLKQVANL